MASKAILVPTAERDNALGLGLYPPIFRGVRAFMYNSFEERALIQTVSRNESVPSVVVGVGSEIPERSNGGRFRQKFEMRDRFAIYVGRIDENKGCGELFEFFEHYSASLVEGMHLVLIGTAHIPIPKHPRIHHLGFLEDQDKYDAMAAAELLIMPSYLESLSMVALEAWAMGKPVLANAKCDVLQGQCLRSNAGLFYENYSEFVATMRAIDTTSSLQAALGRNGRAFFEKNYAWPVIEKKYVDMLQQLSNETSKRTMEPMPGWFGRRRRTQPPAESIVKQLPSGAYRETRAVEAPRSAAAPAAFAEGGHPGAGRIQAAGSDQQPPGGATPRSARRTPRPARSTSRTPRSASGAAPAERPAAPRSRQGRQRKHCRRAPRQAEGEGDKRGRDQRRGRPQRRGRRPGGGGGGAR